MPAKVRGLFLPEMGVSGIVSVDEYWQCGLGAVTAEVITRHSRETESTYNALRKMPCRSAAIPRVVA